MKKLKVFMGALLSILLFFGVGFFENLESFGYPDEILFRPEQFNPRFSFGLMDQRSKFFVIILLLTILLLFLSVFILKKSTSYSNSHNNSIRNHLNLIKKMCFVMIIISTVLVIFIIGISFSWISHYYCFDWCSVPQWVTIIGQISMIGSYVFLVLLGLSFVGILVILFIKKFNRRNLLILIFIVLFLLNILPFVGVFWK